MDGAVLITGSARRIGKSLAISLAGQGYDIAVHYSESRNEAVLLSDKIKGMGVACEIFQADLSCPGQSANLIKAVFDKFSNLNVLINNASIFNQCSFMDTTYDFLRRNFEINLFAPFILTRDFAENCCNGAVINILDSNITKNKTSYFPYLMTKKALADFTRLAALELAAGIRVNGIAPGMIFPGETENSEFVERMISQVPLQEKADIDDIISAVNFLLGNHHITGQIIYVDSGIHLK